jgi:hypothetical protein
MIDFVAYFSTAQDEVGYVVLDGYGTTDSDLTRGPELPNGTYRIENGVLVPVEGNAGSPATSSQ